MARLDFLKEFMMGFHIKLLIVSLLGFVSITLAQNTQNGHNGLCPRNCSCDEQKLETICKDSIGISGLPIVLHPNTKKIVINYAQTSQLTGLDTYLRLETLDIAHTRLVSIDFSELSKNPELIHLNASHNNIFELEDSTIFSIKEDSEMNFDAKSWRKWVKINLIELDLSHNILIKLENYTFIRLHKLQRLDLSYNSIEAIQENALFGLNKLVVLNLRGNLLKQIPSMALRKTIESLGNSGTFIFLSSGKSSSMKQLDMSQNPIKAIEARAFDSLYNLNEIQLEQCKIQRVDEQAFRGLSNLYLLSLEDNQLQEIPSYSLQSLSYLRVLKLSSNNISQIPYGSFSYLSSLEDLELNNNSIRELSEGSLYGLSSLIRFEAALNINLTRLDRGSFSSSPKLRHLNLRSSSIQTLVGDKSTFESLLTLDLRNNSLRCDCDLRWLTKSLKKLNDTLLESPNQTLPAHFNNLTCSGPPALVDHLIMALPLNELECLEPSSDLNVRIAYVSLFMILSILVFVSLINFCLYQTQLLVMLKQGFLAPLSHDQRKFTNDDLRNEPHLYGSDYETVDYNNLALIYSNPGESVYQERANQHYTQHV